jgi:light-regulated signal transduction histidine kinase (bacteriophytochrome)
MVGLTDCDREPIHIPGTIQPFGVLMVLTEPSLTIMQVSENVDDHLSVRVDDVL